MGIKNWFESKTIRFFATIGVVSVAFVAENLFEQDFGTGLALDLEVSLAAVAVAAAGIFLRFVTTGSVTTPKVPLI